VIKKRVLLIGIDGFTWRIGRDLMTSGTMPNLQKMVNTGSHGNLESVVPAETGPAWSSFQTGCLPGKTGLFAFHTFDSRTRAIRLNSYSDICVPTMWDLASRADKTIVSLNLPVTSPPPSVKGVIIPGLLCPALSNKTVYPDWAYDRYIRPHPDYVIVDDRPCASAGELARRCAATEQTRSSVALQLMRDIDWDIFCFQIQSSDILQHRSWQVFDADGGTCSLSERNDFLAFYRCCDEIVARLMNASGAGTLTVVLSDHGFCQGAGGVHINTWLRKNNYLNLPPANPKTRWGAVKDSIAPLKTAARLAGACTRAINRLIVNGRRALTGKKHEPFNEVELRHLRQLIDFETTQAFSLGGMAGMLYVNADGDDKLRLCRELTERLLAELGPQSAQPVITRIRDAAEVYGACDWVTTMPDLVIEFTEGYSQVINPLGNAVVTTSTGCPKTGTHDSNGVVVFNGGEVRQGEVMNARIIDIAPTVLAYLGLSIPRHMDGKVLQDAFVEPLKTDYADISRTGGSTTAYTNEEQEAVERNLKDLGYL
jgi:predicted AlkP superfamily phosphohydrolase/phosphomutase